MTFRETIDHASYCTLHKNVLTLSAMLFCLNNDEFRADLDGPQLYTLEHRSYEAALEIVELIDNMHVERVPDPKPDSGCDDSTDSTESEEA